MDENNLIVPPEQDTLSRQESSEKFEAEAPSFDLKGEDTGEMGIFKRIQFVPNYVSLQGKTEEEIEHIVKTELLRQLWNECETIGWWPDENKIPYEIHKQDDATYLLISFLKKGISPSAKLVTELDHLGIIGINEQ